MARLIKDLVGIGDIVPEATLHVASKNSDEVTTIFEGTKKGTQTADLAQWKNSAGTQVANITIDGLFTTATLSAGSIAAPSISTPTAVTTVSCAGRADTYFTASGTGTLVTGISSESVVVTGTHDGNATVCYAKTISNGQILGIDAFVTAICTAGGAIASGGAYLLRGVFSSSAAASAYQIGSDSLTVIGSGATAFIPTVEPVATQRVVTLSVTGSATNDVVWTARINTLLT